MELVSPASRGQPPGGVGWVGLSGCDGGGGGRKQAHAVMKGGRWKGGRVRKGRRRSGWLARLEGVLEQKPRAGSSVRREQGERPAGRGRRWGAGEIER
eukprot:scaffold218156_cov30-Tisochrysis_lutea.AAC.1